MTEEPPRRDDRTGNAESARDDPFGRPMPDGGLAESMPDWLRRPPAWRGATVHRSPLPPPDTSPIDPRTLIDVEDLPLWLQRIAARADERRREPLESTRVESRRASASPRVEPVVDPHRIPGRSSPPVPQVPEPNVAMRTAVENAHDRPVAVVGDPAGPARREDGGATRGGPGAGGRAVWWRVVALATLLAVLVLIVLLVLDVLP